MTGTLSLLDTIKTYPFLILISEMVFPLSLGLSSKLPESIVILISPLQAFTPKPTYLVSSKIVELI